MINTDQERLIELLQSDIQQFKEFIQSDGIFTLQDIQHSEIEILNFNLLIDFEYFKEIVESECYQLRSPVFSNIGIELTERLELFSKIFLSKLGEIRYFTIHKCFSILHISDFEQSLFIKLLFTIFRRHLITNDNIRDIFLNCLNVWDNFLDSEKIPVNILIQMPKIHPEKDMEMIKDKLYVKATRRFTILSRQISSSFHNSLLIYRTQLSCKVYRSVEEHKSNYKNYKELFEKEWDDLKVEIQDVIFSFYLNLVDFDYESFIEVYPWWFEFDNEKFLKEEYSSKENVVLSIDVAESIVKLYPSVIKSNLSGNEDFIIASHHYMTLHNRDFFPDVILDSAVLLEFLFSRKSKEDIAFQISCNAGLFLANTEDEFLEIFKFVKGVYSIRSALFHGDKWQNKLEKFLERNPSIDSNFKLVIDLKKFISSSLRKLITLMEVDPQRLTDVNKLSKSENKVRKADYLTKLATEYENNKNYSEVFTHTCRLFLLLKTSKSSRLALIIKAALFLALISIVFCNISPLKNSAE